MNTDTFKFECPACGQHVSASHDAIGSSGVCLGCSKPLLVPPPFVESPTAVSATSASPGNPLVIPLVAVAATLIVLIVGGVFYLSRTHTSLTIRQSALTHSSAAEVTPQLATAAQQPTGAPPATPTPATPPLTVTPSKPDIPTELSGLYLGSRSVTGLPTRIEIIAAGICQLQFEGDMRATAGYQNIPDGILFNMPGGIFVATPVGETLQIAQGGQTVTYKKQ